MRELGYDELFELTEDDLKHIYSLTIVMRAYGDSHSGARVWFNVMSTEKVTYSLKTDLAIFLEWVTVRMRKLKTKTAEKHDVWIPAEPDDFEFRLV